MRHMVIENGEAVNAIEVLDPAEFPQWTLVRSDTAAIGDLWDGQAFTKPPAPARAVPQSVPMAAARTVMRRRGITAQMVIEAINASPDPDERDEALIAFEFRTEVRRHSPLVLALAPALNLDEATLDDMFIEADELDD